MAAFDSFQAFLTDLNDRDRSNLQDYIDSYRQDMLAARSEDARVRIAENFIRGAIEQLRVSRRR